MKKSLLALAVLGAFAGVASAQSSVTIYGLIDESISKGNGGTSVNGGTLGASKAYQVRDNSSGSRLGFRGNEDLGGGWSAQFLLEHRFNPDTGAQNNATSFWQGGSYVQLTNASAGSVYLGRWYTPSFWINFKADPFAYAGISSVSVLGLGGVGVGFFGSAGNTVRTANTIGYKTPNLGGFTVNLATGLGEAAAGAGRQDGVNFEYAGGPLWLGGAYERIKGGAATIAGNKVLNFGAAYDFKVIRPLFYIAKSEAGTNNNREDDIISLGLTAPIGAGVLKALVLQRTTDNPPAAESKLRKYSIGYDYFLSKRTRVYADVAQVKETGLTTNRAYALGVRHEF
jgi:predicted porin